MAIIPASEKELIRIYWCPICKESWVANKEQVNCSSYHPAGLCCHFKEAKVSRDRLNLIYDFIKETVSDQLIFDEKV